jgi:hypothetical protein
MIVKMLEMRSLEETRKNGGVGEKRLVQYKQSSNKVDG